MLNVSSFRSAVYVVSLRLHHSVFSSPLHHWRLLFAYLAAGVTAFFLVSHARSLFFFRSTNEARGMNEKLQEVAELRAHMEGLPAEVISGSSTLLRTTEPALELKDGHLNRRELILFTDQ